MENVLIQIRHPVVPDRNVREERQRPRVSRAYDEDVDLFDRGTINEVDCSARDVRDRWLLQDVRMLESVVAEVQVWSMAFDDGDDGVSRYSEQIEGDISAGTGSVSFCELQCGISVHLHRSSNHDNTLQSNCQPRSQKS